jgi:uncharacterized SAM-binding protein YcdF (DUF218 family)
MYDFLSELTRPLTLIVLALVVVAWRAARPGQRAPVIAGLLALVVVTHPLAAWWLLSTLERQYPAPARTPHDIQAIVVLSGYMRRAPDGSPVLGDDSLVRTVHAASLYHALGARPLVATGGPRPDLGPGVSIAGRMRDLLVQLGVAPADVIVEGESRSTYENAAFTRRVLDARGARRILLVTEALHMPRSVVVFRSQGFDVVPAPCGHVAVGPPELPGALLPSARAALGFQRAAHEWMGLAYYWLRGYSRAFGRDESQSPPVRPPAEPARSPLPRGAG